MRNLKFEAWVKEHFPHMKDFRIDGHGLYNNNFMHEMSKVWEVLKDFKYKLTENLIPEGYKLVPTQPTTNMIESSFTSYSEIARGKEFSIFVGKSRIESMYKSLLENAPTVDEILREVEAKEKAEKEKREIFLSLLPKPGSGWIHKEKKSEYEVITVTNVNATKPGWDVTVVYEDIHTGEEWSRPLSIWLEKYEKKSN